MIVDIQNKYKVLKVQVNATYHNSLIYCDVTEGFRATDRQGSIEVLWDRTARMAVNILNEHSGPCKPRRCSRLSFKISETFHPVTVCHILENVGWASEPVSGVCGEWNPSAQEI
jgi:hypothetical protein